MTFLSKYPVPPRMGSFSAVVIPMLRVAQSLPLLLLLLSALLSACGESPAAMSPPPSEVSVVTVTPEPLTLTRELPGRLEAWRVAEIRARVAGILEQRLFTEGSDVNAGDTLYHIDSAPYVAALERARAALAHAEATQVQADSQLQRSRSLRQSRAISEQDLINAEAVAKQAAAEVQAARAELRAAEINLDYTRVQAPIAGRIGRSLVTEGALVGQGEATPLAVVQQIDPLYVNFTQSSAEVLGLRKAVASGQLDRADTDGSLPVDLILEDGSTYPLQGQLLFSDLSVDRNTGQITLRARIDNPEGILLPGMYVRVRVPQALDPNALLLPQQAVIRDATGNSVLVVGADGQLLPKMVEVGPAVGNRWLIENGLKAGDTVVVDGFMKLRPGAPVITRPWRDNGLATN